MNRLFQHYEGSIDDWSGSRFSCVKSIEDELNGDVILLWMKDDISQYWYRLFIDGVYCGVDRYSEDKSSEDMDDDILCLDRSQWFTGKILQSAKVFCFNEKNRYISLIMNFGESEFQFCCRSEDGDCELLFYTDK